MQPELLKMLLFMLATIAALGIIALVVFQHMEYLTRDAAFLFIIGSIFLVAILGIIISGFLFRISEKNYEVSLRLQYMEAQEKQDRDMKIMMERLRHLRHELKGHASTMYGLCDTEQYDVLMEYLKGLTMSTGVADEVVLLPNNKTLSIILANKKAFAIEKKVPLKYEMIGKCFPLTDMEQSSLFGNILDNAIEACEKLEPEQRWIALRIEENENGWNITCQNPYKVKPIMQGENWLTNKAVANEHGIGTRVMKGIVKERYGNIDYHVKDDTFTVAIFLPKGKEKE